MREFTFPNCVIVTVLWAAMFSPGDGGMLCAQTTGGTAPLSDESLHRKLTETFSVSWSGVPLGEVVESIRRNTRVCLWLDRRVDRDRRVEWSSRDRTLRETLEGLAAAHDLGVAWIGGVAYIAPKWVAQGLPTLIKRRNAEIKTLPLPTQALFARRSPLVWDKLAEPSRILTSVIAQAGWSIENDAVVPHDLWAGLETPPMSLTERLSLLTAGFELTFLFHSATNTIALRPWPTDLANPANTTPAPKPAAAPTGTAKPAMPSAPGRQVYTLRVKDVPLSKLIEVLKQKHGLNIRVNDPAIAAAGLTLEKATAVDIQNATLEALLEQAVAPLGLHARRDGDAVVIEPKK